MCLLIFPKQKITCFFYFLLYSADYLYFNMTLLKMTLLHHTQAIHTAQNISSLPPSAATLPPSPPHT